MQQLHGLIANQIAIATSATTIAAHATGVACFELPLRGEVLAAWLYSLFIWPPSAAKPSVLQNKPPRIYRNTARTLSHSDAPARSPSAFDDAGCAALTGSDAGKLSIRPVSSFAWVSRSAKAASRGIGGVLVVRRRLELLSHLGPPLENNASAIRTFPTGGTECHPGCPGAPRQCAQCTERAKGRIFVPHGQYCTDRRCNFGSTTSAVRLHPHR